MIWMSWRLLLIPGALCALTWGELSERNERKIDLIERLFQEAIQETGSGEAALALMGSHSYGIALADSDLEFALLISPLIEKEAFQPLADRFYALCQENRIFWDEKGWHPPVEDLRIYPASQTLVATPAELAFLRMNGQSVTLRYALYNPKFGGGSKSLFDEFCTLRPQKRNAFDAVVYDEWPKTKSELKRTLYHAKILKQLYLARRGEGGMGVQEQTFTIKGRWIKPTVELLQFLLMEWELFPQTLFEGIRLLEREGVLDPEFAERIRSQLIFEIELRDKYGMIVSTRDLSNEELLQLAQGYSLLSKLEQKIVRSR